jgi:hypothetical protein
VSPRGRRLRRRGRRARGVRGPPRDDRGADALAAAVRLRAALGAVDAAAADARDLARRLHPADPRRDEAAALVFALDDRLASPAARAAHYRRFLADQEGLGAEDLAAVALALPPVADLGRGPRQAAALQRRLAAWVHEEVKLLDRAETRYRDLLTAGDPATAVAALARVGQLWRHFAARLEAAPPPPSIPARLHGAYCDALSSHADALERRARDSLRACVTRDRTLGLFGPWGELCAAALERLEPRAPPGVYELRPEPRALPRLAPAVPDERQCGPGR